jgi:regulator of RNase E activity RraB
MASVTEDEIQAAIAGHRARNAELGRVLASKGVELTEKRPVDVHFWADDQHDAALLAKEGFRKGFLVKLLCPSQDSGDGRWNVEAGALVPPDQVLGDHLTEQLVRIAANCGAVYDGWGTQV